MKCRTCGHPIKKIDNVYPEFKRELLEKGLITGEEGLGIYDIRCFEKFLREANWRGHIRTLCV